MAALVYGLTLCPTVYVEGSGELIGSVRLLGTPHPTGYPLFCLLGRLVCAALPTANPAWPVSTATAMTHVAAVAAVAWLLLDRGVSPWAAAAGALALAFSRTFWSQAVIAEVYGLSLLTAVLALWATAAAATRREPRSLLLAAYAWGLGAAAHLTQVLLLPVLAATLAWRWPALRRQPRAWVLAAIAAAAGYSTVLYLPLRNGVGSGFHWSHLDTVGSLWDHLTGALYRSSFFALPVTAMVSNGWRWLHQVLTDFTPVLVPLAVWGAWCCWRRDRVLAFLASASLGVNLAAALNYHRDPNGLGVFFLTGFAVVAVFVAYGADDVGRRVGHGAVAGIAVVAAGALLATNWGQVNRSDEWTAHRLGADLLASLPPNAVVVAEGDDLSFVLDYLLRLEAMRPDVRLYNRMGRGTDNDLLTPAQRRLPMERQQDLEAAAEAELIRRHDRPVYYLAARGLPAADHQLVPDGLAYRVVRQGEGWVGRAPVLDQGFLSAPAADPWVRKLKAHYWYMQGEHQLASNAPEAAARSYTQAAATAADSRSMRFNVALAMVRCGQPAAALPHALAACELDPWQAGPHRLAARLASDLGQRSLAAEQRRLAEALADPP